jgi:ribonuclease E
MGFNPILILDQPPLYKNYTVNIIRPGIQEGEKEINKILEEDQQKNLDQSDTKNNNEDMIPIKLNNTIEKDPITSEEKENTEEKDINVSFDEEKIDLSSSESKEVNEDPRRKRRRSSASS